MFFDFAPIHFHLSFAGAATSPDASGLFFQMRPEAFQARQTVFQQSDANLHYGHTGACSAGKNVENQLGAIHDFDARGLVQIFTLAGVQIMIEKNTFCATGLGQFANFLHFAFADVRGRMNLFEVLNDAPDHNGTGGVRQTFEFF
jgi:hypothetical protein